MKLPFYTYEVEDDETLVVMDCNSLVDIPAHMKSFVTFSNQRATIDYKKPASSAPVYRVFNEEERIVMGVMISAGTPIYRNDPETGEYFGIFTKPVITKIKERLMRQQLMHNMNTMHEDGQLVKGAFMTEIFQVDAKRGIAVPEPLKNQNLQDGTLIACYKITDNAVWSDVKSGKYRGFSIEAYLNIKEAIVKKNKMAKQATGKTKLGKVMAGKLSEISKWDILVDQDTFEVGTALTTTWKDGDNEPITNKLNDGEYATEDGKRILVDSDGIVRLVFNKQSNMSGKNKHKGGNALWKLIFGGETEDDEKKFATATDIDGTVLSWEGDLAVGTAIMIDVNGEMAPAPGGEYQLTLDDGTAKMVTIDDAGLVTAVSAVEEMSSAEVLQQVAEVQMRLLQQQVKREAGLKTEFGTALADLKAEIETLKAARKDDKFTGKKPPAATGGDKLSISDIMNGKTEVK